MTSHHIWMGVGIAGQLLFMSRFLVQWISSEAERRSVIPVSFWYLSLAGSTLLLAYSIWRQDIVFMVGQGAGFFIYIRNLQLIGKRAAIAPPSQPERAEPEPEAAIVPFPRVDVRRTRAS